MKTIIVPVNFSANSNNAARYAADMALSINAELQLFHVLQVPITAVDVPTSDYLMEELQTEANDSLEELKQGLMERTNGKVKVLSSLQAGCIEFKLEEFCEKVKPFLVVMGVTGDSMEKVLTGSSTVAAVRQLRYPLVIVPGGAIFHVIKKIVLACDLRDLVSDFYVDYLNEIKNVFHASIEVINIIPDKEPRLEIDQDSFAFNSWNNKLRQISPEVRFIRISNIEDGIAKYLYNHPADLLFVLPKNHHFFEFHKSHSKRIAMRSPIPVMCFHA